MRDDIDSLIIAGVVILPALFGISLLLSCRHAKWKKRVFGFWAVTVILALFVPVLFTFAWHLRHKNTFEYKGTKMRVPLMWIASISEEPVDQRVDLNKFPVWLVSANKVQGTIFLGPWDYSSADSPEQVSKAWTAVFWTMHSGKNEVVTGPIEVKISSGSPARCMESSYTTAPSTVNVSCLLLQLRWKAEFFGERKNMKDFFDLIRSLD